MISVILSTFNNEKTISDSINSILNQTHKDFELIIINDCSTDKTKEIIKSFNDKRIVFIDNKKNIGRSNSRNKAIKIARGDFVAIIDGDDISALNRLEVQVRYLINNPGIDLVACNVIYFHKQKVLGNSLLKKHKSNFFNFYLRSSEMPHPTWMARANFFKKYKYNPLMDKSEDSDLLFRARIDTEYSLLKDCLVFYRIPQTNNIKYRLKQIFLLFLSRSQNLYKKKNFYFFPLIILGLFFSALLHLLGFKKIKMKTSHNSKYQNILNKLIAKKPKTIVNIISSIKGGGAEVIVEKLDKFYLSKGLNSFVIYFSGELINIKKNHFNLNLNPRNPLGIFYIRKIIKKLIELSNDDLIVHVHLTWPFFYVVLAVIGLKNLKLFFTEHDTTNKRRSIPFFFLIDNLFYKYYSCVICISRGVYLRLTQWIRPNLKKKLMIVYNGSRIFNKIKRKSLKNRLPRLISVGRLIKKKNFLTTVKAVSMLKNKIESYTIIGEGIDRPEIQKLIIKLKLEHKIKMIGWVDDIEKYYQNSDIQLIPSLYEGFGLVAVEGMSTGLPIVASNIVGLKEVLGKPNESIQLIKNFKSTNDWANGIDKTINKIKSHGTNKISKISYKQARKFSIFKMVEDYIKLYTKFN